MGLQPQKLQKIAIFGINLPIWENFGGPHILKGFTSLVAQRVFYFDDADNATWPIEGWLAVFRAAVRTVDYFRLRQ